VLSRTTKLKPDITWKPSLLRRFGNRSKPLSRVYLQGCRYDRAPYLNKLCRFLDYTLYQQIILIHLSKIPKPISKASYEPQAGTYVHD
jgi:hypothetical protein